MAPQVTTNSLPTQNHQPDIIRRNANFKPSIWGDRFLTLTSDNERAPGDIENRVEIFKEEVRRELMATTQSPSKQLSLIDDVQRLGVAYHFEKEIKEILEQMHITHECINDDLYIVSLLFRLLRQQGFNISCDIFKKFIDDKGNFSESLKSDVEGMLGLYEATHLRKHGEDILDEALNFTTTNLKSSMAHLSNPLLAKVANALDQPLHKGLRRLEAKRYICTYQEDASYNETLLNLAKLDFNLVQSLHKKELCDISRWWKELDFSTKLPFARDRVVELYFWIVGVYFEPKYSLARKILTKVMSLTSIIDDIYDVYGTLEEIELFTNAIERWDISSMDQLPEYMKICYCALLDVFKEIENEMVKEKGLYKVHYAREAMKNQVRAYFEEAKWFHKKYIPTMEEYMHVALVTGGYSMLIIVSFVGMGDIATKEAFDWVCTNPKIVKGSEIISRLMDDMMSHKFEQKRGHCASAIECYMKQYGASEQQARDEFNKQLVNAWKDINEDCLQPTDIPMPLLSCILNFSRAMEVIYKDEDGYTNVGENMRNNIASLLIDPMPI